MNWIRQHGRSVFVSLDCYLGAGIGVITGAAATQKSVREGAVGVLIPAAGVSVALSAVVLAAIAILATFFDDWYRRVLEAASGSVAQGLTPYRVIAVIAGIATLVCLLVAVSWPVLTVGLQESLFGLAIGLTAWTVAGCVQLTNLTIWHADQRARLMRGVEDAKLRVSRLQEKHPA